MSRRYRLLKSFGFAGEGVMEALKNEPNFRIHLGIGSLAILLALILGFKPTEWVVLMFTIAFVLIMELLNTAIEAIVDLATSEISEKAKLAKDVSASAVLVSATFAVFVGLLLFAPKIIALYA